MTRAHWRCDAVGKEPQAFDTREQAERAEIGLKVLSVVWFCQGNWGDDAPRAPVFAHRDANSGAVGSKVIRKLLGRQIEDERDAS